MKKKRGKRDEKERKRATKKRLTEKKNRFEGSFLYFDPSPVQVYFSLNSYGSFSPLKSNGNVSC